jgi:cell division protein FtsB
LVIIFVFGDHGLLKLYKIKNERKLIQNKITNLRAERETLKNEKNKIENDLNYIEKIAREKYKMVKPGEKIFKVIDN